MKKNNLLILIGGAIIAMMFFALISLNGSVNAADGAGNTTDLQTIVNNAVAGDGSIVLDKDYEIDNTVFIGSTTANAGATDSKNVTLDLNGHVICTNTNFDANKKAMIEVNGDNYNVTVKDSDTNGEIRFQNKKSDSAVTDVCALFIRRGTVTIEGGKFTSLDKDNKWGVIEVGHGNNTTELPSSAGKLIMNGGIIDSERFGITLEKGTVEINNGASVNANSAAIGTLYYKPASEQDTSLDFNDTEIVVNGGKISSEVYTAIQHKSDGDVKIKGGEISGTTGVYSAGGNVEITGGTITAIEEPATLPYGTSGDVESNGAVVVNENNFEDTKVTVDGGTLVSEDKDNPALYLASEEENAQDVLEVKKVTSNKKVDPEFISSNLVIEVKNEDGETTYYMGSEEDKDILEAIESLENGTITVTSGDLNVSDLPLGVSVKNEGTGNVEINGHKVEEGKTVDLAAEKLAELEEQLKNLNAALTEANKQNGENKDKIEGLEDSLSAAKADLKELKENSVSKEDFNALLEKLSSIEKELADLKAANNVSENDNSNNAEEEEEPSKGDELDEEARTKTGVEGNIAAYALGMLSLAGAVVSKRFVK